MDGRRDGQRLEERVLAEANRLGFDLAGIAPASPARRLASYKSWLSAGHHGEMGYLSRIDRVERRENLARVLPGVKSIVSVALNYYPGDAPAPADDAVERGLVARYAWGEDYHELMLGRLEELAGLVSATARCAVRHRAYVDTGPLLERDHAAQAGLGFIGKNTCLINPRRGSWLFLGELLVDVELQPTPAAKMPSCGSCRRCLDACPTGALIQPYVLDARRCISYLTIELEGAIPLELRPLIGNRLYGCDVCQDACPWQRFARITREQSLLAPGADQASPALAPLLKLGEQAFQRRYQGTALERTGRARLLRNVAVVLGNCDGQPGTDALIAALGDSEPLVRGHAAWALGRRGGEGALAALRSALSAETDEDARREIQAALMAGV
jgi:epoxyqueuosine reductase